MLANLERGGTDPTIIQVGYGKGCSLCADDFIYTPDQQGGGAAWPGTLTPQSTHRVRGIVSRAFDSHLNKYYTLFTVVDVTTGVTQTASVGTWAGGYVKAWWGAEALDFNSDVGVEDSGPDDNFAYMGYSTYASTSILYRSGMVFNVCYCENEPPGSGPSDIEKEGNRDSREHGHLGTWIYGNDMVNFESHI